MENVTSTGLHLLPKEVKGNSETVNNTRKNIVNLANESFGKNKKAEEFVNNMSNALDSVAKAQNEAAKITKAYEVGTEQDLTKVVVSQQISKLAFQITLNVRNKVLSAYKDIMNMPV